MKRALLLLALLTFPAQAQIAYLLDDFVAAHVALGSMTVTQHWGNAATECPQYLSAAQNIANVLLLAVPIACAVWYEAKPECFIFLPTWASDLMVGHELRHCFQRDYHNVLGFDR